LAQRVLYFWIFQFLGGKKVNSHVYFFLDFFISVLPLLLVVVANDYVGWIYSVLLLLSVFLMLIW